MDTAIGQCNTEMGSKLPSYGPKGNRWKSMQAVKTLNLETWPRQVWAPCGSCLVQHQQVIMSGENDPFYEIRCSAHHLSQVLIGDRKSVRIVKRLISCVFRAMSTRSGQSNRTEEKHNAKQSAAKRVSCYRQVKRMW